MPMESSGDDVEGMESGFPDFVVPPCHGQTCRIFNRVFGEDHAERVAQSVCCFYVGIFLKKYFSPLSLSVSPFVCGLEQQISGA